MCVVGHGQGGRGQQAGGTMSSGRGVVLVDSPGGGGVDYVERD